MPEHKDPAFNIPLIRAVYAVAATVQEVPTSELESDQALEASESLLHHRVILRHINDIPRSLSVGTWLKQQQLDAAVLLAGANSKTAYAAVYSDTLVVSSHQQQLFKEVKASAIHLRHGRPFGFRDAFYICCALKLDGKIDEWESHAEAWTRDLSKVHTGAPLPEQKQLLEMYARDRSKRTVSGNRVSLQAPPHRTMS